MKKNIALLAGGYSGEYAISVKSAVTVEENLDSNLFNVYKIIVDKNNWMHTTANNETVEVNKDDFSLLLGSEKIIFDAAFIIIHGTPGEDGKIQGYLDMLKIPYPSCNAVVSALTFNKIFCNALVAKSGLVHVSNSTHLLKHKNYQSAELIKNLPLPVFVKPVEGGSSLATFKIKTEAELMPAIEAAFEVDNQVMIERFVKGREISVGVFRNKNKDVVALPITELISTKEFFDFEAKYTDGLCNEVTPADFDKEMTEKIQQITVQLYDVMVCSGVVRIDYIIEESTNDIYFLEVNTIPGQSQNSIIPQQVRAMGGNLKEFYAELLQSCFNK